MEPAPETTSIRADVRAIAAAAVSTAVSDAVTATIATASAHISAELAAAPKATAMPATDPRFSPPVTMSTIKARPSHTNSSGSEDSKMQKDSSLTKPRSEKIMKADGDHCDGDGSPRLQSTSDIESADLELEECEQGYDGEKELKDAKSPSSRIAPEEDNDIAITRDNGDDDFVVQIAGGPLANRDGRITEDNEEAKREGEEEEGRIVYSGGPGDGATVWVAGKREAAVIQIIERLRPLYQLKVSVEVVLPCNPSRTEKQQEEDGFAYNAQVVGQQDSAKVTETATATLCLGKSEIKNALVRWIRSVAAGDMASPWETVGGGKRDVAAETALQRWVSTGSAPRRAHLVRWLLRRLELVRVGGGGDIAKIIKARGGSGGSGRWSVVVSNIIGGGVDDRRVNRFANTTAAAALGMDGYIVGGRGGDSGANGNNEINGAWGSSGRMASADNGAASRRSSPQSAEGGREWWRHEDPWERGSRSTTKSNTSSQGNSAPQAPFQELVPKTPPPPYEEVARTSYPQHNSARPAPAKDGNWKRGPPPSYHTVCSDNSARESRQGKCDNNDDEHNYNHEYEGKDVEDSLPWHRRFPSNTDLPITSDNNNNGGSSRRRRRHTSPLDIPGRRQENCITDADTRARERERARRRNRQLERTGRQRTRVPVAMDEEENFSQTAETPERTKRPKGPERLERLERPERSERWEISERPDRPETETETETMTTPERLSNSWGNRGMGHSGRSSTPTMEKGLRPRDVRRAQKKRFDDRAAVAKSGPSNRGNNDSWDDDRWRLTTRLNACKRELAEAEERRRRAEAAATAAERTAWKNSGTSRAGLHEAERRAWARTATQRVLDLMLVTERVGQEEQRRRVSAARANEQVARSKQPFRERRGRSQKGPYLGPRLPVATALSSETPRDPRVESKFYWDEHGRRYSRHGHGHGGGRDVGAAQDSGALGLAMQAVRKAAAACLEDETDFGQPLRDLDADGDGFLTLAELGAALRRAGAKLWLSQVTELFRHFDPAGSDVVDYREFLWEFVEKGRLFEQWRRAGDTLGGDQARTAPFRERVKGDKRSARLSPRGFFGALDELDIRVDGWEARALLERFQEGNDNDDGNKIDWRQFVSFMQAAEEAGEEEEDENPEKNNHNNNNNNDHNNYDYRPRLHRRGTDTTRRPRTATIIPSDARNGHYPTTTRRAVTTPTPTAAATVLPPRRRGEGRGASKGGLFQTSPPRSPTPYLMKVPTPVAVARGVSGRYTSGVSTADMETLGRHSASRLETKKGGNISKTWTTAPVSPSPAIRGPSTTRHGGTAAGPRKVGGRRAIDSVTAASRVLDGLLDDQLELEAFLEEEIAKQGSRYQREEVVGVPDAGDGVINRQTVAPQQRRRIPAYII